MKKKIEHEEGLRERIYKELNQKKKKKEEKK